MRKICEVLRSGCNILDVGRLRRRSFISAGSFDMACNAMIVCLEGVNNGAEVRSSHGMTKATSVTFANADRKSAGGERIWSIFVASFVLVWIGRFPREDLCLVRYLTIRCVRVMDHVFCVNAEIRVTQVISSELRNSLRGGWGWGSAFSRLESVHDVAGTHSAALEELCF